MLNFLKNLSFFKKNKHTDNQIQFKKNFISYVIGFEKILGEKLFFLEPELIGSENNFYYRTRIIGNEGKNIIYLDLHIDNTYVLAIFCDSYKNKEEEIKGYIESLGFLSLTYETS